jgi:glycosyltransferase involved in cell wall biosynthesis
MMAGRALVISPRLPEFDRESGLLRILHVIEMLQRRGWEVTFGCLRLPTDPERYARELEQRGVEVHAPLRKLDSIRDVEGFDLAIIAFWHVAEGFLTELREACPSTRLVVDSVDLHFVRDLRDKLRGQDTSETGQLGTSQAGELIRELNAYAAADAVLTVSDKEADLINDLTGRHDFALTLPDTEELPRSRVPLRERRGILFLGNFLHAPNRDAASYLCKEIVPRLNPSLLSEHEISIVGTEAGEQVGDLAAGLPNVKVVGWVPSVIPYLNSARVSVVPVRYGAGTKRKIVQALMVGTPSVTTAVGAEGLGVRDRREVLIADDPSEFAAAIERLLKRQLAWRGLARRGRRHVLRLHGRAAVEARFDQVLEAVLTRRARPAPVKPVADDGIADDGIVRKPEYVQLIHRVRDAVQSDVPEGAKVLIATRGDEGFLALEGRSGWHFPRDRDGKYAGYHPADSKAAIAHLEELRDAGATHLVLPRPSFWWLEHYGAFRTHLDAAYREVRNDEDAIVYELTGAVPAAAQPASFEEGARPGAADGDSVAAGPEGDQGTATPPEVTPDLVRRLQPSPLAAASRFRNGDETRRALVLGIYLADEPNTAEHVAGTFAGCRDFEVEQRWIALGGEPADGQLGTVTAMAVSEPTPKYALLNKLLAEEDLAGYDFVVSTDDDIVLPDGFADLFLGVQAGVEFDLAQPARTPNSYVDHPIVVQQRGVVARRTRFVEIGPLVSFGRAIYDLVFPFDETSAMGWGFENVWAHRLRERGRSQGIVDAVPMDHSIRKPVAHYEWSDADADRERYLASQPHLPLEECIRVLDVIGVDR